MNSVWTLGDWLQYLFSFIFVIGLLLTLLWTLRKLQGGASLLRKNTQRLQTLETLSVGTRQKIMLIRVDDREILVGVTAQQMTVLTPWPEAGGTAAPSPEKTNTP
ncbi:MAG: flagellar biosynthetic protein FliO [Pseudomonadota bacterium]|jgi:flagellar protein FliO/FliZ